VFLVRIDFRIAFVGGNHEIMLIRFSDQVFIVRLAHNRAIGIAGRADIEQLAVVPGLVADAVKVRKAAAVQGCVDEHRGGAGKQGCPFVDLVERVGAQYNRVVPGARAAWAKAKALPGSR